MSATATEVLPPGWKRIRDKSGKPLYLDPDDVAHEQLPQEPSKRIAALEKEVSVLKDELTRLHNRRTETFFASNTLPHDFTFVAQKGQEIVLHVSGSGFSHEGGIIGVTVVLNGQALGDVKTYTNEKLSHKAFVSRSFKTATAVEGNQLLSLKPMPGTASDHNDFFSAKVTIT